MLLQWREKFQKTVFELKKIVINILTCFDIIGNPFSPCEASFPKVEGQRCK